MATDVQDRGCEGEPPPLPPRKARETAGSQSSSQLPHVGPSTSDSALTSPDRVPPTSCRVEELRRIITGPFGLVLMPSLVARRSVSAIIRRRRELRQWTMMVLT
ncbi:hypothetical protein Bbelb_349340 [Branchiostoma belcheri]|nr:hypothetical protein Bbelb_349340 [Branchiostoma belcheri]